MHRRITHALYAAVAAGIAVTSLAMAGASAQAGAVARSSSAPRHTAGLAGYTAEGRWFRTALS